MVIAVMLEHPLNALSQMLVTASGMVISVMLEHPMNAMPPSLGRERLRILPEYEQIVYGCGHTLMLVTPSGTTTEVPILDLSTSRSPSFVTVSPLALLSIA